MHKLVEIFCDVDDFCHHFMPLWEQQLLTDGQRKRRRTGRMQASEIMTIIILFDQPNHRDFKNYYKGFVTQFYADAFPDLLKLHQVSGGHAGCSSPLVRLFFLPQRQAHRHCFCRFNELESVSQLSHSTPPCLWGRCWTRTRYYGLVLWVLHLIINHEGDILAAKITPGNVDDRKPVPELCEAMSGKLYGDKGYISQALASDLFDKGVEFVTNVRKNMKAKALSLWGGNRSCMTDIPTIHGGQTEPCLVDVLYPQGHRGHWLTEEYFSDRTLQTPLCAWLYAESYRWINCVLSER